MPRFSSLHKYLKRLGYILLALIALFFVLHFCFPLKVNIAYSTVVTDSRGQMLHAFLAPDQKWRMYTETSEITPELEKAIIFKEDRWFYYHPGINPVAMARAAFNNIAKGRRTSGASTITMQVARLLYPGERTYTNKITEIFRAMQLELKYSKREILQLYLNLVPYGGNIEGIKSASVLFFRKSPTLLSLAEITALSVIPNRPTSLKLGAKNEVILEARNQWLNRFDQAQLFDHPVIADALNEPLNVTRRDAPRLAPHLSIRLKRQFPRQPVIRTCIQLNRQLQVEQLVHNYMQRLKGLGIHQATAMVVDNATRSVLVYVGSAGFEDHTDGGQVDGIMALRSPGSALKPLIYAAAFDEGLITPKSILLDVPINFDGYEPENYDRSFHGKVTAQQALASSLNIPAVDLLHRLGTIPVLGRLQKARFKDIIKRHNDLGLSVALGGCGVTVEEMAGLYSAFANRGRYSPLVYTAGDTSWLNIPLVSEEAAFMTTEVLTQLQRPDLPYNYQSNYHIPRIAWKTGTSYGRRDAWSIGYNKAYTVAIWVGNFSGEGSPELSGAQVATPLLFDIFNTIDYNSPSGWFVTPKRLDLRYICPESGDIPQAFCTSPVMDVFIPGISPVKPCEHKKLVMTNAQGTISYCTDCAPAVIRKQYFDNPAPELITYYESRHIPYQHIPPHNPACLRVFGDQLPVITSPTNGAEYYIDTEEPPRFALSCHAAPGVNQVYWYINNKLLSKEKPGKTVFFTASPGKIRISCTDDKGRTSHIQVLVRNE